MRWLTTLTLVWFVWLVVSEGSLRRAVRRATATVRALPTRALRLVSSTRRAADAVVSTSTQAGRITDMASKTVSADSADTNTTMDSSISVVPVADLPGSARNALDTLERVRRSPSGEDGGRREALVSAQSLLRLSSTASDSVNAYVRLAKAHRALDAQRAACAALSSARKVGGTDAVRGLEAQFDCAP